ncbi:MAG TPA: RHS repeat-associated core domain-containing protein, partial [Longimicrobium sp.]|nr:RHS repeat-associated core domain-containing protein [Longimicrobium sp.]
TVYTYTAIGGLQTVTDPLNQVYTIHRDALGRVTSEVDPRGGTLSYTYDRAGNQTGVVNRRGQTISLAYDARNQVVSRTADGQQTTWSYDPAGRWMQASNPASTDRLEYDVAGRQTRAVVTRTGGTVYTLESTHDAAGQRTQLAATGPWTGTRTVRYVYDALMRLDTLVDLGGGRTKLYFNDDGKLNLVALPSGTVVADYFTSAHISAERRYDWQLNDALAVGYTHDRLGNIGKRWNFDADTARAFSYDALGNLTGFTDWNVYVVPGEGGTEPCHQQLDEDVGVHCTVGPGTASDLGSLDSLWLGGRSYDVDAVGNRIGTGVTVQTGNRITTYGAYTLEYDADGNLTRKHKSGYDQVMTWNSLGQLTSVTVNGVTVRHAYDAFGRWVVRRHVGGDSLQYVYDGDDLLLQRDAYGGMLEFTFYPGTDRPHSTRQNGQTYYYAEEEPGSVTGLIDGSGALANHYRYDPFGETEVKLETASNPFRFAGRHYDGHGRLYQMRARWYDPELGRFISEDPIRLGGGINPYVYAGNNPLSNTDPSGMWCEVRNKGEEDETLHCEDIKPHDFYTIRAYLGGSAGDWAFELFKSLGWTTFGSGGCGSGFSESQCGDLARGIAGLIASPERECSYLGTRASRRMGQGLYRLRSNAHMARRHGSTPSGRGAYGFSIPPFSRRVEFNQLIWDEGMQGHFTNYIAHEEAHIRYWYLGEGHPHDPSNPKDRIFTMAGRCGPLN